MKLYLRDFSFWSARYEDYILINEPGTDFWPFEVLSKRGMFRMEFAPITILYGGNGSGKSTALNIIAGKLRLDRDVPLMAGPYYKTYVNGTSYNIEIPNRHKGIPKGSSIICSEDIFDMTLAIRGHNRSLREHRDQLSKEWLRANLKPTVNLKTIHGRTYDDWARIVTLKKQSCAATIGKEVRPNVQTGSNGENAFEFFVQRLKGGALYLLDEPENSLSAAWQIRLADYLENIVRFDNCQIVIATHSPFLLALREARIYDLDSKNCPVRKWTELENVRHYHSFFKAHDKEFEASSAPQSPRRSLLEEAIARHKYTREQLAEFSKKARMEGRVGFSVP